jgi:hypothetical protein
MTSMGMDVKRRRRSFIALLLFALGAMGAAALSDAAAGPDYARQVVYAYGPVGSSYSYEFSCTANDPSIKGPLALATGGDYPFGMTGGITYFGRRSNTGRLVQVGDYQLTFEPRQATDTDEGSSFYAWGSGGGGGGSGIAYVAVAFWGSTATCTATIGGASRPVEYLGGSHAFFVGPEAFTGGVFAQDGGWHASAARIYRTELKGGPAFASLSMGQVGLGALHFDGTTSVNDCVTPFGNACQHVDPEASGLTAGVFGAVETNGGGQGEMIVLTLPPTE